MDRRTEPPSWLAGLGPVATGGDPPDREPAGDNADDQPQASGQPQADDSALEAPGFDDGGPDGDFGGQFNGPGYGTGPAVQDGPPGMHGAQEMPDAAPPAQFGDPHFGEPQFGDAQFGNAQPGGPGFPDAPGQGPAGFGEPHGPGQFSPQDQGFTGPETGQFSPQDQGFTGPETGQFSPQDQGFTGPETGQFSPQDQGFTGPETGQGFGDYSAGIAPGFVPGPPGPFGTGPAGGPVYGGDPAPPAGYSHAQENGAAPREDAPPFPAQFAPSQAPPLPAQTASPSTKAAAKLTASLKAAKRVKTPRSVKPGKAAKRAQQGRQAQLTVSRFEPWSVMKFSFVISLVAFIVLFVAVAILYAVLSGLGVFDALQRTVESITSSQSSSGFNLQHYLSASRVLGYTGLLGAINVVLITAMSTVGSVLYNITADLAGGVEVTLKETD